MTLEGRSVCIYLLWIGQVGLSRLLPVTACFSLRYVLLPVSKQLLVVITPHGSRGAEHAGGLLAAPL
jgi:hypothetical protein